MPVFYVTIEDQVRADGSHGLLYDHFDDISRAYAKYYTILAAAAVSEIPYHAGYLLRSDIGQIESKIFDRRTAETVEE